MKSAGGGGGGGAPTISLANHSYGDSEINPADASADYAVRTDGKVYGNGFFVENWISDPSHVADYEVQAVLTSGDTPSGTLGSYQAMTLNRTWSLDETVVGSKSCVLTVTIRDIATATVRASATITLSAEVTFA